MREFCQVACAEQFASRTGGRSRVYHNTVLYDYGSIHEMQEYTKRVPVMVDMDMDTDMDTDIDIDMDTDGYGYGYGYGYGHNGCRQKDTEIPVGDVSDPGTR